MTSVLIIHSICPNLVNEITLSTCNFSILNVTLGLVVIIFDRRWRNTEAGMQRGGEHIRDLISFCDKMWPWHLTFSSLSWSSGSSGKQTGTANVIEREIYIIFCQMSLVTVDLEKKTSLPFYQHCSMTAFSQLGPNDCYPVALSSSSLLFLGVRRRALETGKSKDEKAPRQRQRETEGGRGRGEAN